MCEEDSPDNRLPWQRVNYARNCNHESIDRKRITSERLWINLESLLEHRDLSNIVVTVEWPTSCEFWKWPRVRVALQVWGLKCAKDAKTNHQCNLCLSPDHGAHAHDRAHVAAYVNAHAGTRGWATSRMPSESRAGQSSTRWKHIGTGSITL